MSTTIATIAVVGAGVIGQRHAETILACNTAKIICIVDPTPGSTQVAEQLNVDRFHNVSTMLKAGCNPDAAIVCTPNDSHVAVDEEMLSAGIHVLIEKPISTSSASARELINHARRMNRSLLVGHHRRFNPYVVAAKRAIDSGVIGHPIAVSGLWTLFKPASYFEPPLDWHGAAGTGGVVLINMIHEADTLQYHLGPISRVYAEQTSPQRGTAVEEGAAICLRFASGVVGTFVLCDANPSPHSFESGTGENPIVPRSGKDFYRLFGSDGTSSVGDMKIHRYGPKVEKSWTSQLTAQSLSVSRDVPFECQIRHFIEGINGKEQPRCSGEDGLRALLVCEAIKQALKTGLPADVVPC